MSIFAIIFLEVMDKEPTLSWVWQRTGIIGGIGFLLCFWLCFWRWRFALPVFLIISFLCYVEFSEINDLYEDILREAGRDYIVRRYAANWIQLALPLLGASLGYLRTRLQVQNKVITQ
jgi:hypothetical protein